jgi:D-alanyl-D-alanine carboxypeptidase
MKRLIAIVLVCVCVLLVSAAEVPAPEETPAPISRVSSLLELGGNLALVNAQNRISKAYVPEDLVKPDVKTRKKSLENNILMRSEAAQALERMFEAALSEQGHTLYATSGYRAYGIQQILFNAKVEEVGSEKKARRRVAAPGTSEHQMGLAMDVQSPSQLNLNPKFGQTPEGIWVGENAHRFGFIVRYKQEWREITGISDEPWHIRYVGIAHATALYHLDIPLETYVEYARLLPEYVLVRGNNYLLEGLIKQMIAGQTPEALKALQQAAHPDEEDAAMRAASAPFLPEGTSYEEALWYAYPTPKPTSAPRVDEDEETSLFSLSGGE